MREVTSRVPWLAELVASFEETEGLTKPNPSPPPLRIGDASVVCINVLARRLRHTGNCVHRRNDLAQGPAICLAICQYDKDEGYYLFSCDEGWSVLSDTYHFSVDEAMRQAEFEYSGTSSTWEAIA